MEAAPPSELSGVSLDRLDTLVQVTSVRGWMSLATLFAVCAGVVLFAMFYKVPKKVRGEGILLINRDRLSQVRALGSGRLVRLDVTLGSEVVPGQQIGEISQEDLRDTIHETTARLAQLEREDERLKDFELNEQRTQREAIARLREAINRTIENATEGLWLAGRIVEGSLRLRRLSQLSDLEHLKDLQQKHTVQNDLNTGKSRLAELELTWLTAENQRQRARLQRSLEISRLRTRLQLAEDRFRRNSQIISHLPGTVTQILTATDEYVREGAPVVLLSSPKDKAPGTEDVGGAYESVVFVPAGEGKKIDLGDCVEVMPATVKREEHGYIHGEVVAVSELPTTRLGMEAALQHPDLVDAFLKKYAPGVLLRVHVRLERAPGASDDPESSSAHHRDGNPFVWSTATGAEQPLKTGTMCEAAIVVERQPLIKLVLPWLKNLLGYV